MTFIITDKNKTDKNRTDKNRTNCNRSDHKADSKADNKAGRRAIRIKVGAAIFWLAVWEITARCIHQEILLVSPAAVLLRLLQLIIQAEFWTTIAFSFSRILAGFLIALAAGMILAGGAAASRYAEELVTPLMTAIKATPVASFTILVLIWVSSRNLSIIISFLMVLPVVYVNILTGIRETDKQLLEMMDLFRVPRIKRIRYLYIPQVMPYFRTACSLSLGLCWKAGIAAEVIGIPGGSIGEKLYESKVYLETTDLFAWTITIILLSVCFEKCFLFFAGKAAARWE